MKVKKIITLAMAIALLIAIPAVVFAAAVMKAESHATPPTTIEAKFKFKDNGSTLTIHGKAKGLTPGKVYRSLIYGPGSLVKGVLACDPNDPNTLGPRMLVGFWDVAADGKGTLSATNITSLADGSVAYVSLAEIGTISVRGGAAGPIVVACGEVK